MATLARSAPDLNTPKPISRVEVDEALSDAQDAVARLRWMASHVDAIGLKLNDIVHILDGGNDEEAPAGSGEIDVWELRRKWVQDLAGETRHDKERIAQYRAEALNAATDAINTLSGLGRFALAITTLRWDNAEDLQAFRDARPILAAMNVGGGSTESDLAAMCRRLLTESIPVDPTASAAIDTADQDAA
jgi:hypothetical protein